MEISDDSIDGLLLALYKELEKRPGRNEGGTRGPCTELIGVTLRLSNPRARISRSENRGRPFSAIGELLWYLSKSDTLEFIKPYVPKYEDEAEGGVLPGAYGPRLFRMREIDQVANICDLLKRKPSSKRAVIQLFNAEDLVGEKKEIPCTTTLQFHLRDTVLHMSVSMRSNDAFFGLPHDVFCFTMIHELIASYLNAKLGEYIHHAGSMHVYDEFIPRVKSYIEEGYHKLDPMPAMPQGDPFPAVQLLIDAEERIRKEEWVNADQYSSDKYWSDIIRMIQAFWAAGDSDKIAELLSHVKEPVYSKYIKRRIKANSPISTDSTDKGDNS